METGTKEFFSQQQNQDLIRLFLKKFRTQEISDDNLSKTQKNLINFLQILQDNTDFFDANCSNNIEWIGNSFIVYLSKFINDSEVTESSLSELINNITPSVYRLILEAQFNFKGELSFELNSISNYFESLIKPQPSFNHFHGEMLWARYVMPSSIMKSYIQHEGMADIQSFNKKVESIEALKENWNAELTEKLQAINELKEKLDNFKTAFNFVGLYQGFDNLSSSKYSELSWARGILLILAFASLTPVLVEVLLFIFRSKEILEYKDLLLYAIFPTLTLQLILLYFFRVSLLNYKSLKAQLLQIELRKTLCQFIQNYTDFAKQMKSKDLGSLEKFESLIFSGLITNEENLPSTFDGIDQISKVLQSIKPSS